MNSSTPLLTVFTSNKGTGERGPVMLRQLCSDNGSKLTEVIYCVGDGGRIVCRRFCSALEHFAGKAIAGGSVDKNVDEIQRNCFGCEMCFAPPKNLQ